MGWNIVCKRHQKLPVVLRPKVNSVDRIRKAARKSGENVRIESDGITMTPEQVEEIKKHREAVLKAQAMYDAGYEAREEYPGKLMPYGTWDMIDVPMETWYFFRGIIFGKGDSAKRQNELEEFNLRRDADDASDLPWR